MTRKAPELCEGRCGGSGCAARAGGSALCCTGKIKKNDITCASASDVGCMIPDDDGTSGAGVPVPLAIGVGAAVLSLIGVGVVAVVAMKCRRSAKAPGAMKPTVELTESESPNPIVAHEDSIVVHEASQRM